MSSRVRVRVPASSANLGPGFDALGLALSLHNEVTLEEDDSVLVMIEGEGAARLPRNDQNVVVRGARAVFDLTGRRFRGVKATCVNRIPPSRGLGSSAAAWLGGIVGANQLLGGSLDRDGMLQLAARQEGHPDNVAAALLGGLTVACWEGDKVLAVSLPVPADLQWVVLIPEVESSTKDARAVLPQTVSREDAVFNVGRACLFVGGLLGGRPDLLGAAMEDRLHQPYRRPLFRWMDLVANAARSAGAVGCVLSGAGPSLLAVARDGGENVSKAMETALRQAGIEGFARTLQVDRVGTVWESVH
jgi:homoserine kinase